MLPVQLDSQEIVAHSTAHGIHLASGPTAPTDGAKGYAAACLFVKVSATAAGSDGWFANYGTQASAAFKRVSLPAQGQPFLMDGSIFAGLQSTQPIATSGTIALPNTFGPVKVLSAASAATGVILAAGTSGQGLEIFNIGANAITFAASGTSHVAGGTSVSIASLCGMAFRYIGSLWYPRAPAA